MSKNGDADNNTATEQDQPSKVLPFRHLQTPLHYPGKKQGIYYKIAEIIDPYVPDDCTYVDVNLGGGSTLCGFESYFQSKRIIGNDIDKDVITFWECILDKTKSAQLAQKVKASTASLSGWRIARKLKEAEDASEVDRAFAFLYLGKLNYGALQNDERPYGGFEETKESKELIAQNYKKPEEIAAQIRGLHAAVRNRLTLTKLHQTVVIPKYDQDNHVLCVDPPYKGTEMLYTCQGKEDPLFHENLAASVRAVKNAFVFLTYNDCPEIRELYDGCKFHPIENKGGIRNDGTAYTSTPQVLILLNEKKCARTKVPAPRPHPDWTPEETAAKRNELLKQEAVIKKGLLAFVSMGDALGKICEDDLYGHDYFTFEDYLLARWDEMTTTEAYRLIKSAKIYRNLSTRGMEVLPANEGQVRPLHLLPDAEEQAEAWMRAVKLAHPKRLTAKVVQEVVDEMRAKPVKSQPPTLRQMRDALQKVLQMPAPEATKVAKLICALHSGNKGGVCSATELVESFDKISAIMQQEFSASASDPLVQSYGAILDSRLARRLTRMREGKEVKPDAMIPPPLLRMVKTAQLARDIECQRERDTDTAAAKKKIKKPS